MKLPIEKKKASAVNPRTMVIFSQPKVGKTELLSSLEDNLIIDFEGGTDFYESLSVKVETLSELRELWDALSESEKRYKYITFDTFTSMYEKVVNEYGVILHNKDPRAETKLEANYDLDKLAYGKGHFYKREAVQAIIAMFAGLAGECLILSGHLADKSSNKTTSGLSVKDLDIEGKLKNIISAKVDALGLLYRKEKNKNYLSFITSEDVVAGSRSPHLKGKEILISEMVDNKIVTHWDQIFV